MSCIDVDSSSCQLDGKRERETEKVELTAFGSI